MEKLIFILSCLIVGVLIGYGLSIKTWLHYLEENLKEIKKSKSNIIMYRRLSELTRKINLTYDLLCDIEYEMKRDNKNK